MSLFKARGLFASASSDSAASLLDHYGVDADEVEFDLDGAEDEDVFGGEAFPEMDVGEDPDGEVGGTLFSTFSEAEAEAEAGEPTSVTTPVTSSSRLAMARRVRAGAGADAYGAGYLRGLADALAHVGASDPEVESRMGRLWHEAADTGVSPSSALPDAFGALTRRATMATRPSGLVKGASIEADHVELPPVYVADSAGVREQLTAGSHLGSHGEFAMEDRFGDAALAGYVGSQRRAGARRAAEQSIATAAAKTAGTVPGRGAAFIEDREAEPRLFSDGSILDAVYGALRPVPCPSCSSASAVEVKAGHTTGCGVCDSYGAVLVPETDAPSFLGVRYGFLVPLIVGLGGALLDRPEVVDRLIGAEKPKPKRKKKAMPTFQWTDPVETEAEVEATPEAAPEVARAVVPSRWFQAPPSTST